HADLRERPLMERADLSRSPAAVLAATHALELAGVKAGDLATIDLYSLAHREPLVIGVTKCSPGGCIQYSACARGSGRRPGRGGVSRRTRGGAGSGGRGLPRACAF